MQRLDDYILSHIDPEPEHLYRLWRATNLELLNGRMASGHLQGRLLKMLVEMIRPRRILEVGTFSGYSALCLAEGLADDDCAVYTFEVNDEVEDFARRWIDASPYASRADNTLWDGHVVDTAYDRDHQTQGIRHFNDHLARDTRVEKVILPLRDGLTLIRKK